MAVDKDLLYILVRPRCEQKRCQKEIIEAPSIAFMYKEFVRT